MAGWATCAVVTGELSGPATLGAGSSGGENHASSLCVGRGHVFTIRLRGTTRDHFGVRAPSSDPVLGVRVPRGIQPEPRISAILQRSGCFVRVSSAQIRGFVHFPRGVQPGRVVGPPAGRGAAPCRRARPVGLDCPGAWRSVRMAPFPQARRQCTRSAGGSFISGRPRPRLSLAYASSSALTRALDPDAGST